MKEPLGAGAETHDADPTLEDGAWDGMLLFAADGRLMAATPASFGRSSPPPVTDIAALEARYRQSDGMPIDLRRRGRHVALPIDGRGPRVILISEPLQPTDGVDAALAVAIDVFRGETDPQTVQRALGSVLAHELRTPMTTVFGGAELLARTELPEGTRVEAARSVVHAAEQLHRVVEDLVVLVRWSGDRVDDAEPVLLAPILRAAARRAGTDVPIDIDARPEVPAVAASPLFLDQIARNLIEHAVTNSPPGGRVRMALRDAGELVELIVSDDGTPRTEEDRARAFELFAPTSRQSSDPSGANLPLVAARLLTERLGGRISAGSPPSGGQTIVRLPAIRDDGPPEPV